MTLPRQTTTVSPPGPDQPTAPRKPSLSFVQILNMNLGFFGIQFSFGLQQSNMSPIFKYLGTDESSLPYLWLAGPITGLIVQPIIGALSDRTVTRFGRRTPYFIVGTFFCALCLLGMPFSSALWVAVCLQWVLDTANNVAMEPYRAFVSDKLDPSQHSLGFLTQSAFTGLSQTLAYLTPSLLLWCGMNSNVVNAHFIPYVTVAAFLIGAILSVLSMAWTLWTTREIVLSAAETARLKRLPVGIGATLREIGAAIVEMPSTMKQLALVKLFQWYAMFCYWQFIVLSLSSSFFGTTDATTAGFREAGLMNGQIGAFYNFVAFAAAFAMIPLAKRYSAKYLHCGCLIAAGIGMLAIPAIHDRALLFVPMLGIGIAWASMMANPYVMLAGCIPAQRTGVYMGIFNMFIVIPMLLQTVTLPLFYQSLLGGNPQNVIRLAGGLLLCAAAAVWFVRVKALGKQALSVQA